MMGSLSQRLIKCLGDNEFLVGKISSNLFFMVLWLGKMGSSHDKKITMV